MELNRPPNDTLPRWLQILLGLMLCVIVLPCIVGSIALAISPNERAPILAPFFGTLMVLASFWLFSMAVRLVLGKKRHGGLMGPRALRLSAWIFVLIPAVSILSGSFFERPVLYGIVSVVYIGIFFRLRSLS
jgi:hypothetical protein